MLLGLTTDQKLGLAGTAAVFIVFSLVCALLIPRYRPDFPGRRGIGLFIVLTGLLTIAMLGAVEVWAIEEEHAAAEHTATEPGETATTPTPPATTGEDPAAGDAAAGKTVYAENGCGGCHAFASADSSGTVGPNLDENLEGKDAEYVETSIVDPNADVAEGFPEGVMPSFQQLSDEQVDDLVAFLTAS